MLLLTLLSTLNLARAADVRTEVLALGPEARAAIVRLHADGVVGVAVCPLNAYTTTELSFAKVESLVGCRPGAAHMPDTPEARARFDAALEELVTAAAEKDRAYVDPKAVAFLTFVPGLVAGGITFQIIPKEIFGSTTLAFERYMVSVLTGTAVTTFAGFVNFARAIDASERMTTAAAAVQKWPATGSAAPSVLLIRNTSAFNRVVKLMDQATARAAQPVPAN